MAKTEITTAGYQSLRDYIETGSGPGWGYVEIRDGAGNVWERLPLSDARVSWTHDPGATPLVLEVEVSGDDADVTLPEELEQVALYEDETGGDAMADGTITQVTLEQETDQVIIKAEVEIPEII